MKHRVHGKTLGRHTNHRIAMWRNMAASLITHGQITTTIPKAKSVKPFVEKLITAAKKGDLNSRRHVARMLGQDQYMIRSEEDENVDRNRYGEIERQGGKYMAPRVVKHLIEDIAPRYADRAGGYTRIIKLARHRIGDGTDLCVLQLVGDEQGPQIGGSHSRRRQKAHRRMDRAAAVRRSRKSASTSEAAPAPTPATSESDASDQPESTDTTSAAETDRTVAEQPNPESADIDGDQPSNG